MWQKGGTIGLHIYEEDGYNEWWLRSPGFGDPGYESVYCAFVRYDGLAEETGWLVYNDDVTFAVCPALHLDLTFSDLWYYAGTVNSNGNSTECQHENTETRAKEATCNEKGYTGDTYCSDCDAKLDEDGETIPAKGHQWDDGIITTEQATEKGETVKTFTFTCTVCGEKKTETLKETIECQHENTENRGREEATCNEAGYTGDTYCSDCGAKQKDGETIPAKGHQWDDGIITTEQATEKGETVKTFTFTFTCTVCGEKKTKTLKETIECQHGNEEINGRKEATCNEAGYTGDTYCSDCDAKLEDGETIPAKGHQWDDGIITEPETEKEDAVKTFTCTVCGETKTETVKGSSDLVDAANTTQESQTLADVSKEVQAVTDASIAKQSSEDVKGAVFNTLLARATKLTNNTITLKWKKVSKADGYKIYGNQCGKKNHYKLIKDVGKSKTSYIQKKLKKGTYYKYVVAAYKMVDGKKVTIAVSKTIHAVTTGGKYGVAKSVKVNKSKVTLKEGKKFTIKAAEVKKDKTIKRHRKIAYESSNTKVATVSTKGEFKAKKKGSCYIYVYAQNGVYKRVKVTVK